MFKLQTYVFLVFQGLVGIVHGFFLLCLILSLLLGAIPVTMETGRTLILQMCFKLYQYCIMTITHVTGILSNNKMCRFSHDLDSEIGQGRQPLPPPPVWGEAMGKKFHEYHTFLTV